MSSRWRRSRYLPCLLPRVHHWKAATNEVIFEVWRMFDNERWYSVSNRICCILAPSLMLQPKGRNRRNQQNDRDRQHHRSERPDVCHRRAQHLGPYRNVVHLDFRLDPRPATVFRPVLPEHQECRLFWFTQSVRPAASVWLSKRCVDILE